MSHTEPDITAVRDLPPGLPDPTEESLTRVWHTIGRRLAAREAPRRRSLLVPVTAAVVVLGLAVGGVVLLRPDADKVTTSAGSALSVKAVMADMINKARKLPAAKPGPNGLLYTESTFVETANGKVTTTTEESWKAPRQMMPLRTTRNGVDYEPNPEGPGQDEGALNFPTVQWIAAAPTERKALIRYLDPSSPTGRIPAEKSLMASLAEFFGLGDLLVTPQLRVAVYEILADMPAMTVEKLTLAGRQVWAVTHGAAHTYGFALLLDAQTGRTVGQRSKWIGSPPAIRTEAEKLKLPDDYGSLTTWRQAIVASVEDRP
jgi:hypothetical protein